MKPPPAGHPFRRKPAPETPSDQTRNPVQPDPKPSPARQGKRIKRKNPPAGRPLEAATAETEDAAEAPDDYDLADNEHTHVRDGEQWCVRCLKVVDAGLGHEPIVSATRPNVTTLDRAATRALADEWRIRLLKWAHGKGLRLGGVNEPGPM